MTNWTHIGWDGNTSSRPPYSPHYNREQKRLFNRGFRNYLKANPQRAQEFAEKIGVQLYQLFPRRLHVIRGTGVAFIPVSES
jgi:hypothetical protein